MQPQEDPKDTRDEVIYNELVVHAQHVRREEFHTSSCRICRNEMDMVRG